MSTVSFLDDGVVTFDNEQSTFATVDTTDVISHYSEIIRSVGESGAHDVMSTQIDIEQYFPLQTKIPASHVICQNLYQYIAVYIIL